jgi:hypothetical protein
LAECKCDIKPYCNANCGQCGQCEQCKYKETLEGSVLTLKKAFLDFIEPITDIINQIINLYVENLKTYGNNRVAQLATKHKKKRVRKKNLNRIFKCIKKGGK